MYKKLCIIVMLGLFIFSCKEENTDKTLILGHRAAGNTWWGSKLVGNSFEAVKYGYEKLDGIEVDIQVSKNGTLWLIHDNTIIDCNKDTIVICDLTDKKIREISNCTKGTLITLEEMFEYLSKTKEKKFVSLDMKGVSNEQCFNDSTNKKWKNSIAEKIVKLYKKHKPNCNLAVESWSMSFLETMKDKTDEIETYILLWDNFNNKDIDIVKEKRLNGVSLNFDSDNTTKELLEYAKNNDIKVQLWCPNSEENIKKALSLQVFAIQTDNVKHFVEKK